MNLAELDYSQYRGISCDSRLIKPGYIYVAINGIKLNGNDFIPQAIANGASLIISEQSYPQAIIVNDVRKALSFLASRIYPNKVSNLVAVTGTNGKTSVAYFFKQLVELAGLAGGYLGTLGIEYTGQTKHISMSLTTPATEAIHQLLNSLPENIQYLVMEASSHGIDQKRISDFNFAAAAFTNFSQDHLDYHANMEDYLAAKTKLFSEIMLPGKIAVLNSDIAEFAHLRTIAHQRGLKIIDYGYQAESFKLISSTPLAHQQLLKFVYQGQTYEVTIPLIGLFQSYNLLCALALISAVSIDVKPLITKLHQLHNVPGRMQWIINQQQKLVYVDYAHTPDGLETALLTLRPHCRGKLIVVFGCGGDRDKLKRPLMGEIAAKYADIVVITDDNPRSENPDQIRQEIAGSCPHAKSISGREDAISYAINQLQDEGDVLLIAGKGHEKTQIFADHTIDFDDCLIAKKYL